MESTRKNALFVSLAVLLLVALAFISFNVDKSSLSGAAVKKVIILKDDPIVCIKAPCSTEETVTCLFVGSTKKQTCSSSKGSCSGVKRCSIKVIGKMNEKLTWENTCRKDVAYTIFDRKDERVEFKCGISTLPAKCIDSDKGRKYSAKGTASDELGNAQTDYCYIANTGADALVEYYCNSNGKIDFDDRVFCTCLDGACVIK